MPESYARAQESLEPEREPPSRAARIARRVLAAAGNPQVRLRLWNGASVAGGPGIMPATMEIRDAATLWRLLLSPERTFGEGYESGRISFTGDLTDFLTDLYRCTAPRRAGRGRPVRSRSERVKPQTLGTSRQNIHHHYDIGNEFYRLWLDPTLAYTCAYYPSPTSSLMEAQLAKFHHVARKLRLRSGERVIEAGCGWGGFALTVAREYGVSVRAFNISREQIEYARAEAAHMGISSRVEFIEDDYRNITGRCDAFASIGMLEHVGIAQYPELGQLIGRVLEPHGRGLIHSIGRNAAWPVSEWIRNRIFPGAEVPTLAEMMDIFAPLEFAVIDVENLRQHYALTLRDWLAAFEQKTEEVRRMFDDRFVRAWRLYLAGSQAAFRAGEMQLFQVLFAPRTSDDWALTRAHLYAS
jgi:cyclopropane-fatty-acyl-phospholipid synthase